MFRLRLGRGSTTGLAILLVAGVSSAQMAPNPSDNGSGPMGAAPAGPAPMGPPMGNAASDRSQEFDYVGTFSDGKLTLQLADGDRDETYKGAVTLNGSRYAVNAQDTDTGVSGQFNTPNGPFSFTLAPGAGDQVVLTSGATHYTLSRTSGGAAQPPMQQPAMQQPVMPMPQPAGQQSAEQPVGPQQLGPQQRGFQQPGSPQPGGPELPLFAPPQPSPQSSPIPNTAGPMQQTKAGRSVVFTRSVIPDPALNIPEALVGLIPRGWTNKAAVSWCPNPYFPVSLQATIADPQTGAMISWYPRPVYVDGVAQMVARTAQVAGPEAMAQMAAKYPPGSYYFVRKCEPIMSPQQYLAQVVIPLCRPELRNAQASDPVEAPDAEQIAAASVAGSPNTTVKGIRQRFTYQVNGQSFDEDFYSCIIAMDNPKVGITNWMAPVYSQRRALGAAGKHGADFPGDLRFV